MMNLFISTNDKSVADRMIKDGAHLYCIDQAHNYVFANDPKLVFSEEMKKKIVFTNRLSV